VGVVVPLEGACEALACGVPAASEGAAAVGFTGTATGDVTGDVTGIVVGATGVGASGCRSADLELAPDGGGVSVGWLGAGVFGVATGVGVVVAFAAKLPAPALRPIPGG
jgi:hypothetical protein